MSPATGRVFDPLDNGYTSGGLYFEDRPEEPCWIFCQLTGKACYECGGEAGNCVIHRDCRECNVPLVAALKRLSESAHTAGGA